jgi:hypothetical protein
MPTNKPREPDRTFPHRKALDKEVSPQEQIAMLRADIERSGLSLRVWAELVAWRDERTVRIWVNGYGPIPAIVVQNLRRRAREADAKFARTGT